MSLREDIYQRALEDERRASVKGVEDAVSPLTKRSPLANTEQYVDAYSGNFSYANEALGSSVNEAIDENRVRKDRQVAEEKAAREEERQAFNDEIQRNAYAQQRAKQAEALIVPGDTGYNNVDLAVTSASRQLADQAGALTRQLDSGDLGIDEYSQQLATIRSQVPGIKAWKEGLTANLQGYSEALANGQLSKANTTQGNDLYASLLKDDGSFELGVDENGHVMFSGVTEGGEEVSIPVNGIGQMPKPILKTASPWEQLKGPIGELQKNQSFFGDEGRDFAVGQLDQFLAEGGEGALKSLAMDHFNYTEEEVLAKIEEPGEDGSILENEIETAWLKVADQAFQNDELNALQRENKRVNDAKLANAAQQNQGKFTDYQLKQQALNNKREIAVDNYNIAVESGDYTSLLGTDIGGKGLDYAGLGTGSPIKVPREYRDKHVINVGGTYQAFNTKDQLDTWLGQRLGLPEHELNKQQQQQTNETPEQRRKRLQKGAHAAAGGNPVQKTGPSPLRKKSPLMERPPTKEEFAILKEKNLLHTLPGYKSYYVKETSKRSKEHEANKSYFDKAKDLIGEGDGIDYSPQHDEDLIKSVHLPGTTPTSDAERSSIYDDSIKESDDFLNSTINGLEAQGKNHKQIQAEIDKIGQEIRKIGIPGSTFKEIFHNQAVNVSQQGYTPESKRGEEIQGALKFSNPYKKN